MNKSFIVAILPLYLLGCATSPISHVLQGAEFQAEGASKVVFRNVRVETAADGSSQLKGNLRRIGRDPVRFDHLDYRITDRQGNVVEQGQTDYSGAIKQRRSPNPSLFSIPLQQPWQPGYQASLVWDDQKH